jgi:hypothetical protein
MKIDFYNNKSTNNTINKDTEFIKSIECKLKDKEDLSNITLILSEMIQDGIDYLYSEKLKRYYFIKKVLNKGKLWYIECECDLLETYKEDILASKGYITIQEHSFNKYNGDIDGIDEVRKKSIIYYSDTTIPLKDTYIMTALRGV